MKIQLLGLLPLFMAFIWGVWRLNHRNHEYHDAGYDTAFIVVGVTGFLIICIGLLWTMIGFSSDQ